MAKVKEYFKIPVGRRTNKLIGVEIEVEGKNLPRGGIEGWDVTEDGSLRGESAEYVFTGAASLSEADTRITRLFRSFKESGSKVEESHRAGIHVHVNVQDLEMNQLFNLVCIYAILEELLVTFCGERRVGNLFCLRIKDAEHLVDYIVESLRTSKFNLVRSFSNNMIRYASLNLTSIPKYGSLEFRAMRSTTDIGTIKDWVKVIALMKEASKKFDNPQEIIHSFSLGGEDQFLRTVLGDYSEIFAAMENYPLHMRSGMRYAQDIAYAIEWDNFDRNTGDSKPKKVNLQREGIIGSAADAVLFGLGKEDL